MAAFDPYHKWLGIPPEDQPPNHYRLLGVALFESDGEVISHAADQRMAHVRSFQTGAHSAHSQAILNEIASARLCLLSEDKKREYDNRLRAESSQSAFPTVQSDPIAVRPAEIAAKRKRQSANWMPWAVVAGLVLVTITIIAVAAANRPPMPGSEHATAKTSETPKPKVAESPRPKATGTPKPHRTDEPKPSPTAKPKSSPTAESKPTGTVNAGTSSTEKPEPPDAEDRNPVTAEKTLPAGIEEPATRWPMNPGGLPPEPGVPGRETPPKPLAAGMIGWQEKDKEVAGAFKDVRGPNVLVEREGKPAVSVPLKSLLPESQAYVASEIRNRQSRLFGILAGTETEAAMRQDVLNGSVSIRLPARITEVITSKGRALKVNLAFEGFPRKVATRQQMTLRSDPQNFVNVRAGDVILFEGTLSASVKPCAFCDGSGQARCPACRGRGTVPGPMQTQHRTMPDGRVVSSSVPTVVPCKNCESRGRIQCGHPVASKNEEWTPLERKKENRAVASVSTSKGLRYLVVELQDMLVCIVPEATKEPIFFGNVPEEGHE